MAINLKIFSIILVIMLYYQGCNLRNSTKKNNFEKQFEIDELKAGKQNDCTYLDTEYCYQHFENDIENDKSIEIDFNYTTNGIYGEIFNENSSQSYTFEGKFESDLKFVLNVFNIKGEFIENIYGEFFNDSTIKINFNKLTDNNNQSLIFTEDCNQSLKFEKYTKNSTYNLFGNDTSRYCNINISYLNPIKSDNITNISEIQKIIQNTYFSSVNNEINPCKYIDSLNIENLNLYKELEQEELIAEEYYLYVWDFNFGIDILLNDKNILSFCVFNYNYTGGAHGSSNYLYDNIDIKNGKIVELEDIFKPDYESVIKEKIIQSMTNYFNVNTYDELNEYLFDYQSVEITENFYLKHTGICFVYNEYEIAPYVTGQIKAFIEFSEIKDILKKDFIDLFTN
jgi:hypothetical protein